MLNPSFFRENLFAWAARNPRPMPWKGEKDPYKIWLSEIILQQTRVDQGMPYFERFVAKYPSVQMLAAAPEDEILKLWEGLGYYTRARNLHAAAKQIAVELNGRFPDTYEAILSLKGVGEYTAAAIASFAYNLPHAVLDGNVYRVLSRFFAIETPAGGTAAKKQFAALARDMLDPAQAGAFNQAMMDFGALCCTPAQPDCINCPLKPECRAAGLDQVKDFPVKVKKPEKRKRYFAYLAVSQAGDTYVKKRTAKDIWRGLYEFPKLEVETAADLHPAVLEEKFFKSGLPPGAVWGGVSKQFNQILTHQLITAVFIELHLPPEINMEILDNPAFEDALKVPRTDVKKKFAFPRLIVCFIDEKG